MGCSFSSRRESVVSSSRKGRQYESKRASLHSFYELNEEVFTVETVNSN